MRALLTDLDRTLTGADLRPDARALARLQGLRRAGVAVVIVTGRPLRHLLGERLDAVADALVAENGCVTVVGARRVVHGGGFAQAARDALGPAASRFAWSDVIGSGPRAAAADAARRLEAARVPFACVFNADEVMLLPAGREKAAGAREALRLLRRDGDATWAIGDGDNDVPLLRMARVSAAPANASDAAKAAARVRLRGAYVDGFLEFTEPLLREARAKVEGRAAK